MPNNNALITLTDARSAAAEAYRTLRTSIEFSGVDESIRTLLVGSCAEAEGKCAAVANLAIVMADGDRPTILVDADLRRPGQHTLFGLSNERGFTDLFRDEAAFNRPPFQPVLGAASLQLLASGPLPPIPSQILLSKKMDSVLAHLAQLAEIVIFDAPPILAANDALLLASKVDAVLLVVRAGHARRDDVQAAKDRLQKVNARLIGAVLTNAPVSGAVQYA